MTQGDLVRSDNAPGASEVSRAAAATLAVSALYVLNASLHGALGAARNDDWAYLRTTLRFVDTGRFSLDGWTQMSFVGQAVIAWPVGKLFGGSIVTMQLVVAFLAWIGLLTCYLMLRTFACPPAAITGVGLLAMGPIYGTLSTSFMTDVPAFCFQILTLLCATRLVSVGWSERTFIAMCVFGLVAVSIREYGLVILVATLIAVGLRCQPVDRERRVFNVAAATSLALVVVLIVWRSTLANGVPIVWQLDGQRVVDGFRASARAAITLSFLVAPAAALLSPARLLHRSRTSPVRSVAAVTIWLCIGLLSRLQFTGNYLSPFGSYVPLTEGAMPRVLPEPIDFAARLVAFAALLLMLLVVLHRTEGERSHKRDRREVLLRFCSMSPADAARTTIVSVLVALAGLHLLLLVTSDAPFFDRYLIMFVPAVAALIVADNLRAWRMRPRLGKISAGIVVAWFALIGLTVVDASATLDGAKWRFAERLTAEGFEPGSIDAGFEWFGFHQTGVARQRPIPGRNWWTTFYASTAICVTVVIGPIPPSATSPSIDTEVHFSAYSALGREYRLTAVAGPSTC